MMPRDVVCEYVGHEEVLQARKEEQTDLTQLAAHHAKALLGCAGRVCRPENQAAPDVYIIPDVAEVGDTWDVNEGWRWQVVHDLRWQLLIDYWRVLRVNVVQYPNLGDAAPR